MSRPMSSDHTVLDRRWSRLSVSQTISAPRDHVWAAVADHEQWPAWYRPLKELRLVEGTRLAVGAVVWEHEGPWKSTAEVLEWEDGRMVGLAMRTLNLRGLLSSYCRVECEPAGPGESSTTATITGGFSFGPLGWAFVAYTYPQMLTSMYLEYRSALKGLAAFAESQPPQA